MRRRVLLLYGGRSAEHEVSIVSARFIASALRDADFDPLLVGIAKSGSWHRQEPACLDAATTVAGARLDLSGEPAYLLPTPAPAGSPHLHREGQAPLPFEVAFPMLHGPLGEDGCIQGLFELADVPYVGASVASSAASMDKSLMKRLLAEAGLPVLPSCTIEHWQWQERRAASRARCEALGYPLFVKPASLGSSVGIGRADDAQALDAAVEHAFRFDAKVLVETALDAPQELEVAVLGNHEPRASVIGRLGVQHEDGFYSFAAKYLDDGAHPVIPADLTPQRSDALRQLALDAYRAVAACGMARVDLFVKGDQLYVNELNTIPGFTAISMYPQLWQHSGVEAPALVTELIALALERHQERKRTGGIGLASAVHA